jgi:outer membrane protein OmpA-like peptidoglycan-associated protein
VIAREVVGENAVSRVRPEAIKLKDWEISANKGFAKFIEDLAKKFKMSVHLEQKDAENQIAVSHMGLDGVTQFASGSSEPTQNTAQFYKQMATRIAESAAEKSGKKRILIVGHTDDTGDSESNASLAERRARSIGKIFEAANISGNRIFYQGAGEVYPIGDNRTEEGRAKNRRVEIVDLSDEKKFAEYLAERRPNLSNYRPVNLPRAGNAQNVKPIGNVEPSATHPKPVVATSMPPTSSKPPAVPAVASPELIVPLSDIDFGGQPANGRFRRMDIGKVVRTGSFSFISSAFATDDIPAGSCAEDRFRASGEVKSLSDSKPRRQLEYLPGAARTAWHGKVNGHLVGLGPVSVLREGGVVTERPTVFFYKNWVDGSGVSANMTSSANANAYYAEKGLLYRVFPSDGPVRCFDMLIAAKAPTTAPTSNIVYGRNNNLFQVDYSPTLLRK